MTTVLGWLGSALIVVSPDLAEFVTDEFTRRGASPGRATWWP
jgi:hypothetical protein